MSVSNLETGILSETNINTHTQICGTFATVMTNAENVRPITYECHYV
jgi:hypothetical protein